MSSSWFHILLGPTVVYLLYIQDGWMKTGDVGYYNKDGIIYISDRIKELIKVVKPNAIRESLENSSSVRIIEMQ